MDRFGDVAREKTREGQRRGEVPGRGSTGVFRVLSYGFMDFIIVGPRLVSEADWGSLRLLDGERDERRGRIETEAAGDAEEGARGCLNLNLPPVCILWASSKFLRARRNPGGAQKRSLYIHPRRARSIPLAPPSIFLYLAPTDLRDRRRIPAASYRGTRSDRPLHPGV